MFGLFDGGGLSAEDAARLRRVERKLDAILAHLGLADDRSLGLSDEARRLADDGQKIAAIKRAIVPILIQAALLKPPGPTACCVSGRDWGPLASP